MIDNGDGEDEGGYAFSEEGALLAVAFVLGAFVLALLALAVAIAALVVELSR